MVLVIKTKKSMLLKCFELQIQLRIAFYYISQVNAILLTDKRQNVKLAQMNIFHYLVQQQTK